MINFKEELQKYEPILEIDEIESAIHSNELQDMFDLLQYISKQGLAERGSAYGRTSMEYSDYRSKE